MFNVEIKNKCMPEALSKFAFDTCLWDLLNVNKNFKEAIILNLLL